MNSTWSNLCKKKVGYLPLSDVVRNSENGLDFTSTCSKLSSRAVHIMQTKQLID